MFDIVWPTIDSFEIFTIFHILGTILGVGGATISDIVFFKATKDGTIQDKEWGILRYISFVIWTGLIVAILSGIGFLLQMDDINNPKIWAKVTIIGVIFLNGVFLHWKIFPLFASMVGKKMEDTQFVNNMTMVFTSGAISITSWYLVFIMGAWRGLNNTLSYPQMIVIYLAILSFAILTANFIGRKHSKKIITIHLKKAEKEKRHQYHKYN